MDNTDAVLPLSLGNKTIIICVIREGSCLGLYVQERTTIRHAWQKCFILFCSLFKKHRYNVWSFVSSKQFWILFCLLKERMHLPIKRENKRKMPVNATTLLLLLIYFSLSLDDVNYLFNYVHNSELYCLLPRIWHTRTHAVTYFIRKWPVQTSSKFKDIVKKSTEERLQVPANVLKSLYAMYLFTFSGNFLKKYFRFGLGRWHHYWKGREKTWLRSTEANDEPQSCSKQGTLIVSFA